MAAPRIRHVLWSHMVILPADRSVRNGVRLVPSGAGRSSASGLAWFLVASFFNGIVVEMGRKIRAPADEEKGVETYSALWGCACDACVARRDGVYAALRHPRRA